MDRNELDYSHVNQVWCDIEFLQACVENEADIDFLVSIIRGERSLGETETDDRMMALIEMHERFRGPIHSTGYKAKPETETEKPEAEKPAPVWNDDARSSLAREMYDAEDFIALESPSDQVTVLNWIAASEREADFLDVEDRKEFDLIAARYKDFLLSDPMIDQTIIDAMAWPEIEAETKPETERPDAKKDLWSMLSAIEDRSPEMAAYIILSLIQTGFTGENVLLGMAAALDDYSEFLKDNCETNLQAYKTDSSMARLSVHIKQFAGDLDAIETGVMAKPIIETGM